MKRNKILGITISPETKSTILYKIKKYISHPRDFFHIVSLNPENMVIAYENKEFKKAIASAQIKIIDGFGVVLAGKTLGIEVGERLTGIDLMRELIKLAANIRLRVLLIGGKPNLAVKLAECYQKQFAQAKFLGIEGIKDIQNPQKKEEEKILSIVTFFKPHLILAAFGSPWQELWLYRHNQEFKGMVGMGVGQGFDVIGGLVKRAPVFVQKLGFEWLYRLLTQPWRWRRQLRLIKFIWLVVKEKLKIKS